LNMTLVVVERPDAKELQRFGPDAHVDLAGWRLRVDYHPRLHDQQWDIDSQGRNLRAGGGSSDDPADGLTYLCGFIEKTVRWAAGSKVSLSRETHLASI
jgi:hypothetical protein